MSKTKPTQPSTPPADTDLPEGWALATIGDVTVSKVEQSGPGESRAFTYIDIASVDNESKCITAPRVVPTQEAPSRAKQLVRSGDVLVSMTRPNLNAVALVGPELDGTIASTGFDVLRPIQTFPGWLFMVVRDKAFVESMTALVQGALYPAVRPSDVRGFEFPLAPLSEQKRIVAKVEALLERVNAARARLARMPAILKRFRQSVLAAACSGQLTAEWREDKNLEPAAQLLARLREARPTKAELGIEFPVKRWRVAAPRQPQHEDLPSIPETWAWVYLPDLGYMNRGRSRNRPRNAPHLYDGKYPFIQTGDIAQSGGRITSHKQTYSEAGLAQSRLWPAGTICITIAANIADSAILTYPACFPDSVVGLITDGELCVAEFAEFFIRTAREDLSQFAPATAQKNINIGILGEVAVPLPPLDEQREIVRRVEALFALADGIEAHVRAATVRAERLPQAILARAFRGELVPTEADLAAKEGRDYEPASVLLERIAEARKQHKPAPRRRGRGGNKMAKRSTGRLAATRHRPLDEVLREQGKPLTPERLFDLAGFDEGSVDSFYEQLRKLIQDGKVRENRPNQKDVTLEALAT